jgi:hypothetical protein
VGDERKAITACAHCDGVVRPLDVRVVPPAREEGRELLLRPFTPPGLTAAGVAAACFGAADIPIPLVNLLLAFTGLVVVAGTWFNVIDHVGRGKPGFPAPVEADGWPPATLAARGLLCLLLLFTPFGVWLGRVRGAESVGELVSRWPLGAALLGLVSLAWLTAGVLAMLVTVRGLAAYWPPALVRVVALGPERYARLYGLIVGTSAAILLARWLCALVVGRVPFVSSFVIGAATTLAVFAQACLVGGFVRRHREVYTTR